MNKGRLVIAIACLSFALLPLKAATANKGRWKLLVSQHQNFDFLVKKQAADLTSATNLEVLSELDNNFDLVLTNNKRAHNPEFLPDNACVINKLKTHERVQHFAFSLPISLYLSHRLYLSQKRPSLPASLLNERNQVTSLEKIFEQNPQALIVAYKNHSYGNVIDTHLKKVKSVNKLLLQHGTDHELHVGVFTKKSIDFLIEYPSEFKEFVVNAKDYKSYQFAGNSPYSLGYFMCSRSDKGNRILAHINQALERTYRKESFYQAHKKWLYGEHKVEIEAYFDQAFRRKK